MQAVHVLAIITAKPGMRDEVLEVFRANVPAVHDRDRRIDGLRVAGEPSEVNALGAQEALDLLPR